MEKKRLIIILVVALVLVGTAAGLVTWLVLRLLGRFSRSYDTIKLSGAGLGSVEQAAAYARFREGAHMFWWFFPTETGVPADTPVILWLDGVVGLSPSLLANLATVGPYDLNLERRNQSWADYNLLFVDAPVGSGFSFVEESNQAAKTLRENSEDLLRALHSFLAEHDEFTDTPLYVYGQGFGGQMATDFILLLNEYIENGQIACNLQGVVLSNPIISPALVTSQLGFYLEELGYVDGTGRSIIETLAEDSLGLVQDGDYLEAFQLWSGLENTVANTAGAVAINLNRIVDKLTMDSIASRGSCKRSLRYVGPTLPVLEEVTPFMNEVVAPALGIFSGVSYHAQQQVAAEGLLQEFMKPAQHSVERVLQDTDLGVWIFNGNLDAISNTPGQLLWIESLSWSGAEAWAASPRRPVAVSGVLEGYQRAHDRLHLYWMNAAGHNVALDSPAAARHVLDLITSGAAV